MIPHPPELDAAYGLEAWQPYVRVVPIDPRGFQGVPFTPTGGRLMRDMTRWPRDEAVIELPAGLTPEWTRIPVSPYGGRIAIELGARIRGTLFAFRAALLDVDEAPIRRPDGTVTVHAVSHEARVNEDRYDTVTATAAGTAQAVLTTLIRRTMGVAYPVSFPSAGPTLAAGAFPLDGDVWPTVEAIADQAGWDVRFTPEGAFVARLDPVVAAPALTLRTGDGGSITAYDSTRRWAPNRVAVVYETRNTPTTRRVGLWEDTVASSPTRVAGPYGRHTRVERVSVDTLPSQPFADAAAASNAKRSRPFRQVNLRAIPPAWIEPGDTLGVHLLGGTALNLLCQSITIPLDGLDVADIVTADTSDTSEV